MPFEAYERALVANEVGGMDAAFWDDERVVRFGIAEIQHGFAEVTAWRASAAAVPTSRRHEMVTVTALGDSVAVVALEFRNGDGLGRGRQTQVWACVGGDWRIVHAHVSMIGEPRTD